MASTRVQARTRVLVSVFFVTGAVSLAGLGCSHERRPPASPAAESQSPEQLIVERAAVAFSRARDNPRFAVDRLVERARGIMIFPRLVKASLLVGGEGGNGVLVARAPDGTWSAPAFYSVGAPSVGFQIGYQEASVLLFFMEDEALNQALHSDFTLGTNSSVALGDVGERGTSQAETISKPIYQLIEAGGVFAGISLDGYVIASRNKRNVAYYGPGATPRAILFDRSFRRPEANVLLDALAPKQPKAT
jgi:lipid-binding SYLF domain-containing protein